MKNPLVITNHPSYTHMQIHIRPHYEAFVNFIQIFTDAHVKRPNVNRRKMGFYRSE